MAQQSSAAPAAQPERANARRGLRLRTVRGSNRSFYEVADPGALEAVREKLTRAEFEAGLELRRLWRAGTLNGEATSSPVSRLGLGRARFYQDNADDARLEAHDRLGAALRSMGMMGMAGRFAVEVCVYERRVRTAEELDALREALRRLAEHLK